MKRPSSLHEGVKGRGIRLLSSKMMSNFGNMIRANEDDVNAIISK
jgi:hypothetical protein